MRTKAVRRGGLLAAVMAGALALGACGGESAESAETSYVQAVGGDPMTLGLNAQFVSAPISQLFSSQILEPLIRLSDDYKLSPGLATKWEVSPDGLDLTLELRQGVKWHDGEPFTAEDVKFNFDEIVPLQTYGAILAKRIKSVEITGENTVVVHLSEPYGPLLETVALQYMLPEHIYKGTDYVTNEANKKPIGTGPMKFGTYTPGEQVVLVKNPGYWGGKVRVDRAVFTVIPDPNSRAEALFAGEIDEAVLDPSQQSRVSSDPNTKLLDHGMFAQAVVIMMNSRSPQIADPAVRAAVFAALDRAAIAKTALSGVAQPATGFLPETLGWAVNPDVNFDKDFPHDLAAINKALDDAGFKRKADGTRFTLKVRYITPLSAVAKTAQMAQSMLAQVGIGTKLVGSSGAVFNDKMYKDSDFDLAFLRTNLGPDPSLGITRWYECNDKKTVAANPSGICDKKIDAATVAALDSSDKAARGEALKRLQSRAEELMFFAPLAWFDGAYSTISTARWQGQEARQAPPERKAWLTMTPKQ
jgi:peptide/nickel transport system substrate-binding protein